MKGICILGEFEILGIVCVAYDANGGGGGEIWWECQEQYLLTESM